jgi:hypothetical protein
MIRPTLSWCLFVLNFTDLTEKRVSTTRVTNALKKTEEQNRGAKQLSGFWPTTIIFVYTFAYTVPKEARLNQR